MNLQWKAYRAWYSCQYGEDVNEEKIPQAFKNFLWANVRLKVRMKDGRILYGTVGVSPTYDSSLYLIGGFHNIKSNPSLTASDVIIAIKKPGWKRYVPIGGGQNA